MALPASAAGATAAIALSLRATKQAFDHPVPLVDREGAPRLRRLAEGPSKLDLETLRLVAFEVVEGREGAFRRDPNRPRFLGRGRRQEAREHRQADGEDRSYHGSPAPQLGTRMSAVQASVAGARGRGAAAKG